VPQIEATDPGGGPRSEPVGIVSMKSHPGPPGTSPERAVLIVELHPLPPDGERWWWAQQVAGDHRPVAFSSQRGHLDVQIEIPRDKIVEEARRVRRAVKSANAQHANAPRIEARRVEADQVVPDRMMQEPAVLGDTPGASAAVEVVVDSDLARVDWEEAKRDLAADRFDNGRSAAALRRSFERSQHVAFAWAGPRLVGMARLLSDGVCNAYLLDVWTASPFRRRGVGSAMLGYLLERVPGQHVGLQTEDAEAFYLSLGFRRQPQFMSKVVSG
jgi:GNAT superfamily N-acetyltransferase